MRFLGRVGPPIALMALIFFLSAQHNLDSGAGTLGFVIRKLGHATEYGLLWLLWHRALRFRAPLTAAAIAVAYAATDELHQHFVGGRDGTPRDVLIDAGGVLIAWVIAREAVRRDWPARMRRRARARRGDRSEPAALGGDQDGLGPVDRAQLAVDVVQVGSDGARREP